MTRKPADNQPHANKQEGEEKMHGDALDRAVSSAGEHDTEQNSAIPAPDDGGHARSPAAHLSHHVHDKTKPAGDQRGIIEAREFPRQPPQEVGRVGKQHRRQ